MNQTIKIFLIIFGIVIGNIIYYNFKPESKFISNEILLSEINKEIKNFNTNDGSLNINNIYVPLFSNKLNIVFKTIENVEIKTFNEMILENNKIILIKLKEVNVVKDNNVNINILELNKDIKNKLESIKFNNIFKDVNYIYNIKINNNGLNIIYSNYDIKLSEIMIWFSTMLQFFAILLGLPIIFKKYKERLFNIK